GGDAADEAHGCPSQDGEANVVDHLAGVELEDGHAANAVGGGGNGLGREGPQRDGADVADAQPLLTQLPDGVTHELGGGAEGDDQVLGVVQIAAFGARLGGGDLLELGRHRLLLPLDARPRAVVLADAQRRYDARAARPVQRAVDGPVLLRRGAEV